MSHSLVGKTARVVLSFGLIFQSFGGLIFPSLSPARVEAAVVQDDTNGLRNLDLLGNPEGIVALTDTVHSTTAGTLSLAGGATVGSAIISEIQPNSYRAWGDLEVTMAVGSTSNVTIDIQDCEGTDLATGLTLTAGKLDLGAFDGELCIQPIVHLAAGSPAPTISNMKVTWDPLPYYAIAIEAPETKDACQSLTYLAKLSLSYVDDKDVVVRVPLPTEAAGGVHSFDASYGVDNDPTFASALEEGIYTDTGVTVTTADGKDIVVPAHSVYRQFDDLEAGDSRILPFIVDVPCGTQSGTTYEAVAYVDGNKGDPNQAQTPTSTQIVSTTDALIDKYTTNTIDANGRYADPTAEEGNEHYVYIPGPTAPATVTYAIEVGNGKNSRGYINLVPTTVNERIWDAQIVDDLSNIEGVLAQCTTDTLGNTLAERVVLNDGGYLDGNQAKRDIGHIDPLTTKTVTYSVDMVGCALDGEIMLNTATLVSANADESHDHEVEISYTVPSIGNYNKCATDVDDGNCNIGFFNEYYGEPFTYTLHFSNAGPARLESNIVFDKISEYSPLVSAPTIDEDVNYTVYYTDQGTTDPVDTPPGYNGYITGTGIDLDPSVWSTSVPAGGISDTTWIAVTLECLDAGIQEYKTSEAGSYCLDKSHRAKVNVPVRMTKPADDPLTPELEQCLPNTYENTGVFFTYESSSEPTNLDADITELAIAKSAQVVREFIGLPIEPAIDVQPETYEGPDDLNVGGAGTYSLVIENSGIDISYATTVRIDVPQLSVNGVDQYIPINVLPPVAGSFGVDWSGLPSSFTVELGEMLPGVSQTIDFEATIPSGIREGDQFTVPATILVNDDECNPKEYRAEAYTVVHGNPQLLNYKQRDLTFISEEGELEYNFFTNNFGNAISTDTFIVDRLPAEMGLLQGFTSGVSSDGTVYSCEGCEVRYAPALPTLPQQVNPINPFTSELIRANFTPGNEVSPGVWESPFADPTWIAFKLDNPAVGGFPVGVINRYGFKTNDLTHSQGDIIRNVGGIVSNENIQGISNLVTTSVYDMPGLLINIKSDKDIVEACEEFLRTVDYSNDASSSNETTVITTRFPAESGLDLSQTSHEWNSAAIGNGLSPSTANNVSSYLVGGELADGTWEVEIDINALHAAQGGAGELDSLEGGSLVFRANSDCENSSGVLMVADTAGSFSNIIAAGVVTSSDPVTNQNADLWINKRVDIFDPVPGMNLTYTLEIANRGSHEATEISISDTLPDGVCYVDGSASAIGADRSIGEPTVIPASCTPGSPQSLSWTFPNSFSGPYGDGILPGLSESVFISYMTNVQTVPDGTQLLNDAQVVTTNPEDSNYTNSSVVDVVVPYPDPTVSMSVPYTLEGDMSYSYDISYENLNRTCAQGTYIVHALPDNLPDGAPDGNPDITVSDVIATDGQTIRYHDASLTATAPIFDISDPAATGWSATATSPVSYIAIVPSGTVCKADGSQTVTINAQATDAVSGGELAIGSEITYTSVIAASNEDAATYANNTATATSIVPGIDLTIDITGDPSGVFPGNTPGGAQTYIVDYANEGVSASCDNYIDIVLDSNTTSEPNFTDFATLVLTDENGAPVDPVDTNGNPITDASLLAVTWSQLGADTYRFVLGTPAADVCLPAKSEGTFTLFSKIDAGVEDGTQLTATANIAELDDLIIEKTLENNTDSTQTTVYRSDVTVSKVGYAHDATTSLETVGSETDTTLGERITYQITYDNLGNTNASETIITEQIPAGTCLDVDTLESEKPTGATVTYLDENGSAVSAPVGIDCSIRTVKIDLGVLPAPSGSDGERCAPERQEIDFAELCPIYEDATAVPYIEPVDGLIAHYTFDDGTATDVTGNGHDGVENGGVTYVAGVGGGQAASFDGVDDVIDISHFTGLPNGNNPFTISLWIDQDGANTYYPSFKFGTPTEGFTIHGNAGRIQGGAGPSDVIDTSVFGGLTDKELHHMTVSYDGSTIFAYLDGEEATSVARTPGFGNITTDLSLGQFRAAFFEGVIDDVRIYDQSLTSEEIEALYYTSQGIYQQSRADGLVAHYEFEGNANDSSGAGLHGVENGGVTYVDGKIGQAGSFDGVDDYIDLGNSTSLIPNLQSYTFATRVRSDMNINHRILSVRKDGALPVGRKSIELYAISDRYRFDLADGNISLQTTASIANASDDLWHYVVGVIDRENNLNKLYIDGELSASLDISTLGSLDLVDNMYVGSTYSGNGKWNGDIDGVRIYNRALSPEEIKCNYTANDGGLVGHRGFDDGTADDSSAEGNDGTFVNGASVTPGPLGNALSLDASLGGTSTQEYVSLGNVGSSGGALHISDSLTVSTWIKPDNLGEIGTIIRNDASLSQYGIYLFTNGRILFEYHNGTTFARRYSNSIIEVGELTHLGVRIIDKTTLEFYLNGQLDSTHSVSVLDSLGGNTYIGSHSGTTNQDFDGSLDEIRVYNRALSDREIAYLASEYGAECSIFEGSRDGTDVYEPDVLLTNTSTIYDDVRLDTYSQVDTNLSYQFENYGSSLYAGQTESLQTYRFADVDNDGYDDYIGLYQDYRASGISRDENSSFVVQINHGGTFDSSQAVVYDLGVIGDDNVGYSHILDGDVNNDGYTDILVTCYSCSSGGDSNLFHKTQVWLNQGDGIFIYDGFINTGWGMLGGILDDFNNDGNLDLVKLGYNTLPITYYGNGDGTFTSQVSAPYSIPVTNSWGGVSIYRFENGVTGDINGDGWIDMVLSDRTYDKHVVIALNNQDGTYTEHEISAAYNGNIIYGYNGSTNVLIKKDNGDLEIYEYDGSSFVVADTLGSSSTVNGILPVDIDADGDSDLVVDDTIYINRGTNRSSVTTSGISIKSSLVKRHPEGDINGDGIIDLVAGSQAYLGGKLYSPTGTYSTLIESNPDYTVSAREKLLLDVNQPEGTSVDLKITDGTPQIDGTCDGSTAIDLPGTLQSSYVDISQLDTSVSAYCLEFTLATDDANETPVINARYATYRTTEQPNFSFDVVVSDDITQLNGVESIDNAISIQTSTPEINTNNNADATTHNLPITDLGLIKSVDAAAAAAGDALTYTLEYENLGPNEAVDTVITDQLPDDLSYVAGSSNVALDASSDEANGLLIWNLGPVAAYDASEITFQALISALVAGDVVVTNSATISSGNPELDYTNNHNSANTVIGSYTNGYVEIECAALACMGEEYECTVIFGNNGSNTIANSTIEVALDTNANFVSASSIGCVLNVAGDTLVCTGADFDGLDPNTESNFSFIVSTPIDATLVPDYIADIDGKELSFDVAMVDPLAGEVTDSDNYASSMSAPVQLCAYSSLAGNVFVDLGGDGVRNAGDDVSLEGQQVCLSGTNFQGHSVCAAGCDIVAPCVTTDSDGGWSFAGLEPGTYAIEYTHTTSYAEYSSDAGFVDPVAVDNGNGLSYIGTETGEGSVEQGIAPLGDDPAHMTIQNIILDVGAQGMEYNFVLAAPDLVIDMTCDSFACLDTSVSCTVNYENIGAVEAENVSVKIPVPAGVTIDESTLPSMCTYTLGASGMSDDLFGPSATLGTSTGTDFEGYANGSYEITDAQTDFGSSCAINPLGSTSSCYTSYGVGPFAFPLNLVLTSNTDIVAEDGSQVLRVTYDRLSDTGGGVSLNTPLATPIDADQAMTFSYDLKFDADFAFGSETVGEEARDHGKLPGIKTADCAGGGSCNQGANFRLMRRPLADRNIDEKRLVMYTYREDDGTGNSKSDYFGGQYGLDFPFLVGGPQMNLESDGTISLPNGTTYTPSYAATDTVNGYQAATITRDEWKNIKIESSMNTSAGANDGYVKAWLDGSLIMHVTGFDLGNPADTDNQLGRVAFQSYHGGSSAFAAPARTSYAYFDNLKVEVTEPSDVAGEIVCDSFDMHAGRTGSVTFDALVDDDLSLLANAEVFEFGASISTQTSEPNTSNNVTTRQEVPVLVCEEASIGGSVYIDMDADDMYDVLAGDEAYTTGIAVTLEGTTVTGITVSETVMTQPDGSYIFTALDPGTYSVSHAGVNGFVSQSSDAGVVEMIENGAGSLQSTNVLSTEIETISIGDGDHSTENLFGLAPNDLTTTISCFGPAHIGENVSCLVNYCNEGFVEGQTATGAIQLPAGTSFDSMQFATDCTYDAGNNVVTCPLGDLAIGTCDIRSMIATIDDDTSLLVGDGTDLDFTSSISTTLPEIDLTNNTANDTLTVSPAGPSMIAGTVYIDEDRDMLNNNTDTTLENVPVVLSGTDLDGNAVSQIVLTESDGTYLFTNIAVGDYSIEVLPPSSYYDFSSTAGTGTLISLGNGSLETHTQSSEIISIEVGDAETGSAYDFGLVACDTPLELSNMLPATGLTVYDPQVDISGMINDTTATVTLNGDAVTLDANGIFAQQFVNLVAGNNILTISAEGTDESCVASETISVEYVIDHNLSISKSVNKNTAYDADQVIYTIDRSHVGPSSAVDAVVTDILPGYLSDMVYAPAPDSYDVLTRQAVWNLGTLTGTTSGTIEIQATVSGIAGEDFANTVSISSNTSSETDIDDNTDVAEVTIVDADLYTNISCTPYVVQPGESVTCVVDYGSNGTIDANNFNVSTLIPIGLIDITGSTGEGGSVLIPDDTGSFSFVAVVDPAYTGTQLNIGADISSSTNETVINNNSSTDVVYISAPTSMMTLEGSVMTSAGDPLIAQDVTITGVANNGDTVNMTVPTNSVGEYVFSGLLPGDYVVSYMAPTAYIPISSEEGTAGGDATDLSHTVISDIMLGLGDEPMGYDFIVDYIDLDVSISCTPQYPILGSDVECNIMYENLGSLTANNIVLDGVFPAGYTISDVLPNIATLDGGESGSVTMTFTVPNDASAADVSVDFDISISADETETDMSNNDDTDDVRPTTSANNAPVANNDDGTTPINTDISLNILTDIMINDVDANGDDLTMTEFTQPTHGTVVYDNVSGEFIYTPDTDFVGVDMFEYTICDDAVPAQCDEATITILVTPTPPIAGNDYFEIAEDETISVDPLITDSPYATGDVLIITGTPVPSVGTIVMTSDTTFDYAPPVGFVGTVTIPYEVCDEDNECATAVVVINVEYIVPGSPVALDDDYITTEDTSVTYNPITENDTDPAPDNNLDPDSVTLVTTPTHGEVVVGDGGEMIYTPDENFSGVDSYVYEVCDEDNLCDTAVVTITIAPVNDVPVAIDDNLSTNEDTPVVVTVLTNDSDIEDDALTVTQILTDPENGIVVINDDGTVVYTPDENYTGVDTFEYEVCDDGSPVECASAIVTITINPINDTPMAVQDDVTTAEDMSITIDVLANDNDIDDSVLTMSGVLLQPTHGTLVIETDGTITYTPSPGYVGMDTFKYEVCDDGNTVSYVSKILALLSTSIYAMGGDQCATAVVTITIDPVNDAPVGGDDTVSGDMNLPITIDVLSNDMDEDSTNLSVDSVVTSSGNGTVVINTGGTIIYTPNIGYVGTDIFEYEVCDEALSCDTVLVTVVINAPAVSNNNSGGGGNRSPRVVVEEEELEQKIKLTQEDSLIEQLVIAKKEAVEKREWQALILENTNKDSNEGGEWHFSAPSILPKTGFSL